MDPAPPSPPALIILPPSLPQSSRSSTQCLAADLCICFHQLLDEGSCLSFWFWVTSLRMIFFSSSVYFRQTIPKHCLGSPLHKSAVLVRRGGLAGITHLPGIGSFQVTEVSEQSLHNIITDNLNHIHVTQPVANLLGNFPKVF